jgi:hypothetical protein
LNPTIEIQSPKLEKFVFDFSSVGAPMPPANYDYLDQNIVATCLIQAYNNDSFYNPVANFHSGFAADGTFYLNGVQQLGAGSPPGPIYASWYTEFASPTASGPEPSRDFRATFPTYGVILLSPVAMTILDESTPVPQSNELKMWMQFAIADGYMMTDNYTAYLPTLPSSLCPPPVPAIQGFTPSGLSYADGIISITYTPDSGNQPPTLCGTPDPIPQGGDSAQSHMVVSIDFSQDAAYVDVAL